MCDKWLTGTFSYHAQKKKNLLGISGTNLNESHGPAQKTAGLHRTYFSFPGKIRNEELKNINTIFHKRLYICILKGNYVARLKVTYFFVVFQIYLLFMRL